MTTRKFTEELCELKQSLTSMCLAVERMIEDNIKALVEQDGSLRAPLSRGTSGWTKRSLT
ncbi:MAG: hypothetical protein ACLTSK_04240 [Christensenellales bacterium]